MIFSYKKLIKLANINEPVEKVVEAINSIGFEVEEVKKFNEIEGIKFGHVVEAYKNENADRLTVCEIQLSDRRTIIQTTATNVKKGDYLMCFVPGSKSGKTTFTSRVMQGIESHGMLISLSELGFDEQVTPEEFYDQIFTFGKVDLTLDPLEHLDLRDWLIDVTILSNRADANSYLIMAKELAAYFDSKPEKLEDKKPTFYSDLSVGKLEATKHFTLLEANVKNEETSLEDKLFLWKHGFKTFSHAVNLSNLTLLYSGVPCHVYPKNALINNVFWTSLESETVNILGNKEVKLENNLVVKNDNKIVSIAGTIGLENIQTRGEENVVFELASFDLKEVRKSAKQIKLETPSSNRASKEICFGEIKLAHEYLTSKLNNFTLPINDEKIRLKKIKIDPTYINKYAGSLITKTAKYADVLKKLSTLEFKFNKEFTEVTFPTYRYDLETLQDFVEEVFRFYGYNNFKAKTPDQTRLIITDSVREKMQEKMVAKGYQNVRTFTLINPQENKINVFNFNEDLLIPTSKNLQHSIIRKSMAISLFEVMINNQKQGISKGSYFEIGMIQNISNVLGLISNEKTFNEIKKDIISLTNQEINFKKEENEFLHPNVSAFIYLKDTLVGYIGKIHPAILKTNSIFAEIFLDKIESKKLNYKTYAHLPLKSRDLTINLKTNESVEEFMQKLKSYKGIFDVKILGIYKKEDGTQNVTFSFLMEEWATKKFDKDFNE
ncbi:phenylalanyl-tRNA synthetase beta subunit [Metamycoplasma subdolum]|uniref:Phenylalanine--tRNA ligase beta subunit n=1 Tax=Metamycoplasma subdolum TaxID=92407 RepID=A0A3M0A137_9BACT|nr:phenylalanine--tRNA ligase subunit beta [Metamycoplasma subdolum]RMA78490.1 phenylalanyl-tRNA synthetase beta subunit [Metamycoplasma subdolum]WPB50422.1 phenylalanine--tRNA ligase subunit beta [Metamycoplasma subdolum]